MKKKIIPILFQKELHYMRLRDYITKSRAVPLFGRILLADKKRARRNCPHGASGLSLPSFPTSVPPLSSWLTLTQTASPEPKSPPDEPTGHIADQPAAAI